MPGEAQAIDGVAGGLVGLAELSAALATLAHTPRQGAPIVLLRVGLAGRAADSPASTALGRQLRAGVRAADLVGCLGEAGYAILLKGAKSDHGVRVANRLAAMLDAPVAVTLLRPGDGLPLGPRLLPEAGMGDIGAGGG